MLLYIHYKSEMPTHLYRHFCIDELGEIKSPQFLYIHNRFVSSSAAEFQVIFATGNSLQFVVQALLSISCFIFQSGSIPAARAHRFTSRASYARANGRARMGRTNRDERWRHHADAGRARQWRRRADGAAVQRAAKRSTGRNWCRWHWHNGRKNTG